MSLTTAVAQTTAGTVSNISSSTGAGLYLTNPTATSSMLALGTKAAFLAAIPILVSGAAFAGIALLSYAVTKAAMET